MRDLSWSPSLWRRRWYAAGGRQRHLTRPVVSVGNLSVGGRGKTPTVAYLARLLLSAGERPAILSRGYARRVVEDGVVVVSDGVRLLADLPRSGDEPLMLANDVLGAAVLVCEDRTLAGTLAERALGATVHLLDDGFQHLSLARDLDLVIVSPGDLADRPLPFGRLREPVASLAVADAIIVDDDAEPPAPVVNRLASAFSLRRSLGPPVPVEPDRAWPEGRPSVVGLAGIAQPDRFFRALKSAGWPVARTLAFPDHHSYNARDVQRIASAVREAGASVVLTTSKDAVRLSPLRPLPVAVAAVPLDVAIEPVERFRSWFFDRLREAQA